MDKYSKTYEYWHAAYMINGVTLATLDKLVSAGRLTRDEVNGMIAGREDKYGY